MLEHLLILLERELLGNEAIKAILQKIDQEGDKVIQSGLAVTDAEEATTISGYGHDGQLRAYFYNSATHKESFKELKQNFAKPFIVRAYEQPEYICFTDIADKISNELRGSWVIAGKGEAKILAVYPKKEEMENCKEELFLKIDGWALVHQVGTTIYKLVNTDLWIYNV